MSQSTAQWSAFIKEIIKHRKVWTIKDVSGIPTSTNIDGETSMPFWSLKSRAEQIIENVPAYSGFQPYEIKFDDFLNRWLKGLEKDGLYLGVNWSGKRATGYDMKPKEVLERIQNELNLID
ncbi:DUF2750 domain-containing protein [Fredinandcohnia sp. QZ13]|uniref:DUF2750 domain-containing protein n=1 Tax=Fredinandcohnia sp. QZ13 TaxID=3073144 RepID=UPI0028533964|nr:DUF2750 domain-containing protein [Fredinandcohnia sp. QZ13]MDR4886266.1 DUF2750 domain-containing protein [Fredinandcohnia sp. QZ13]